MLLGSGQPNWYSATLFGLPSPEVNGVLEIQTETPERIGAGLNGGSHEGQDLKT